MTLVSLFSQGKYQHKPPFPYVAGEFRLSLSIRDRPIYEPKAIEADLIISQSFPLHSHDLDCLSTPPPFPYFALHSLPLSRCRILRSHQCLLPDPRRMRLHSWQDSSFRSRSRSLRREDRCRLPQADRDPSQYGNGRGCWVVCHYADQLRWVSESCECQRRRLGPCSRESQTLLVCSSVLYRSEFVLD